MCNDCSHYVDFDLAKKIISQSGLKDDSPGTGDAVKKKAVDDLVSKMADFAGLTESQVRYSTDPGKRSSLLKKNSSYICPHLQVSAPAINTEGLCTVVGEWECLYLKTG